MPFLPRSVAENPQQHLIIIIAARIEPVIHHYQHLTRISGEDMANSSLLRANIKWIPTEITGCPNWTSLKLWLET